MRTAAYDAALALLEKNKVLFLIGDPGVGKTVTSKMLVLQYAAQGYRVRYTASHDDLRALKRTLSRDPAAKEVVLLDDCFGQAYFRMRSDRCAELLSLIRYVDLSVNKRLILNSRVTIYREAREREPEWVKSLERGEYRVHILDMSGITPLDKAHILYNHIVFQGVEPPYYAQIRRDRRYLDIVKHPNYNPRLIEFVCDPNRYRGVAPEAYYDFICRHLADPREIWRSEYEQRLQKVDRLLLLTVYTLSDEGAEASLVETCFQKRIAREPDIDRTVNQFEAALARLTQSFLRLADRYGRPWITMANPSVNDYLDGRLARSPAERQDLLANAVHIRQVCRLLPAAEYPAWVAAALRDHTLDRYDFSGPGQKNAVITLCVVRSGLRDAACRPAVCGFLTGPLPEAPYAPWPPSAADLVVKLLKDPALCAWYGVAEHLAKRHMGAFLERFSDDIETMIRLIVLAAPLFFGTARERFLEQAAAALRTFAEDTCRDIESGDYDPDVEQAIRTATDESGEIDQDLAAAYIEWEVEEAVREELRTEFAKLPPDLPLPADLADTLPVYVDGAFSLVSRQLRGIWDIGVPRPRRSSDAEIDLLFGHLAEH